VERLCNTYIIYESIKAVCLQYYANHPLNSMLMSIFSVRYWYYRERVQLTPLNSLSTIWANHWFSIFSTRSWAWNALCITNIFRALYMVLLFSP
jgi:hypothetical protein